MKNTQFNMLKLMLLLHKIMKSPNLRKDKINQIMLLHKVTCTQLTMLDSLLKSSQLPKSKITILLLHNKIVHQHTKVQSPTKVYSKPSLKKSLKKCLHSIDLRISRVISKGHGMESLVKSQEELVKYKKYNLNRYFKLCQ